MCDICDNDSGGHDVGIAAIPGVPMSIMWCNRCLDVGAFPSFVFEHDFIFVAEGDLSNLNEWALNRVTWVDGQYIGFKDYVKRITPEQVKRELKEAGREE